MFNEITSPHDIMSRCMRNLSFSQSVSTVLYNTQKALDLMNTVNFNCIDNFAPSVFRSVRDLHDCSIRLQKTHDSYDAIYAELAERNKFLASINLSKMYSLHVYYKDSSDETSKKQKAYALAKMQDVVVYNASPLLGYIDADNFTKYTGPGNLSWAAYALLAVDTPLQRNSLSKGSILALRQFDETYQASDIVSDSCCMFLEFTGNDAVDQCALLLSDGSKVTTNSCILHLLEPVT